MNMLLHNLKVAWRNLMKYKFQTVISVLSIAIGIVTLSLVHSIMDSFRLPSIYYEPYSDRAYRITFQAKDGDLGKSITIDLIRALKRDGGPRSAERIAVPNHSHTGVIAEFHLTDSTVRKGQISANFIDPEYANYTGLRSALTGKKIKVLKAGEAIIEENYAKAIFGDANPIGAVQTKTGGLQIRPVTIVDVYKKLSYPETRYLYNCVYYCLADSIEDYDINEHFFSAWIDVVRKEGRTEQQLLGEVNERIKPFGLEAKLDKTLNDSYISSTIYLSWLAHAIGSLILLAAIIGYLRMQIQMFSMRRREVSLRIVNGAKQAQLFGLLVTEVIITISLSITAALLLGIWLQNFIDTKLDLFMQESEFVIQSLWLYSLVIGGALLAICSLAAWVSILRVAKSSQGLAANMRHGRTHLFRNVMLSLQIAISIAFVCATFILVRDGERILKVCNVPSNDDFYKECIVLRPSYAEQPKLLLEEIGHLPDLDKMVMCDNRMLKIKDVAESPEAMEHFNDQTYFHVYCSADTSLITFYGMEVEWFKRDIDRGRCMLIDKALYSQLQELGLLDDGTLTLDIMDKDKSIIMPVAGFVNNIPYNITSKSKTKSRLLVAITPDWESEEMDYVLVPKPGQGKALARSVDETIERLEPAIINQMARNFREVKSLPATMVETIQSAGWILAGTSILICTMSIFSTIALDTRSRKKEVAIRKVNGAKSRDIYRLFGRAYLYTTFAALLVAVPVVVMFDLLMKQVTAEIEDVYHDSLLSSIIPIGLGIIVCTTLVTIIVGWQIHKVMKVNPAEMIAKE